MDLVQGVPAAGRAFEQRSRQFGNCWLRSAPNLQTRDLTRRYRYISTNSDGLAFSGVITVAELAEAEEHLLSQAHASMAHCHTLHQAYRDNAAALNFKRSVISFSGPCITVLSLFAQVYVLQVLLFRNPPSSADALSWVKAASIVGASFSLIAFLINLWSLVRNWEAMIDKQNDLSRKYDALASEFDTAIHLDIVTPGELKKCDTRRSELDNERHSKFAGLSRRRVWNAKRLVALKIVDHKPICDICHKRLDHAHYSLFPIWSRVPFLRCLSCGVFSFWSQRVEISK